MEYLDNLCRSQRSCKELNTMTMCKHRMLPARRYPIIGRDFPFCVLFYGGIFAFFAIAATSRVCFSLALSVSGTVHWERLKAVEDAGELLIQSIWSGFPLNLLRPSWADSKYFNAFYISSHKILLDLQATGMFFPNLTSELLVSRSWNSFQIAYNYEFHFVGPISVQNVSFFQKKFFFYPFIWLQKHVQSTR